jgi:hypothetical protein
MEACGKAKRFFDGQCDPLALVASKLLTFMDDGQDRTRREELERRLTDLKARLPAHSIPPSMMMELDDMEEQPAELRSSREEKERS